MPGKNTAPTVSFPLAVKDAEGNITAYKTVHVVVVEKEQPSVMKTIVLPFGAVLIGAAVLIWALLKIKPGKKTDKILNRFEGFGAFFGTDREK